MPSIPFGAPLDFAQGRLWSQPTITIHDSPVTKPASAKESGEGVESGEASV
jgi:hypothetical protein